LTAHQAEVSRGVGSYLEETAAKLTDAQSELTLFSKSYLDKELVGLKKGMAQQEKTRKDSYNKQLASLSAFANNPVMFAFEFARLQIADANNKKLNEIERRLGLARIAQSLGVNARIIEDFENKTEQEIELILRARAAWLSKLQVMQDVATAISSLGSMFSQLGNASAGAAISAIGSGFAGFLKGLDTFSNSKNLMGQITGIMAMAEATIGTFVQLAQVGSRTMRVLGGAASGATAGMAIGFMAGGPVGAGIGAGIGAIVGAIAGAFLKDPGWKKAQQTVGYKWNLHITKELADQIDKDSKILGGHVNSMLMHMTDIIKESGGLSAGNVGMWAFRLGEVFPLLERGAMNASQAAKTLDATFNDLVAVGTTTNGWISDQIRELVRLEQQYKTGSKAIEEFIDKQLGMVTSGFTQVVGGAFGSLLPEGSYDVSKSIKKQTQLNDQIATIKEEIIELNKKDKKTEEDKLAIMAAQFQLAQLQNQLKREQARGAAAGRALSAMAGPGGQEEFDRMGRLALVTFNAMIGSGKTFLETLDAMGPSLDILSAAQDTFGFKSSEAFGQLLKFREFATLNPELVGELAGLQNMMAGLANTGFLTQETFTDLGAEATSVFARLQQQGLTGDEALQMMQPTLQMLWEAEQKFGYKADEATQALIDQQVEAGNVGEKYMSANDRMVLGIDRLIERFDVFLDTLGIRIPNAAQQGKDGINDAGEEVNPWTVDVEYRPHGKPGDGGGEPPDPIPMAEGGVLTRPILAGEAGPEAIIPLDRLFDEVRAMQKHDADQGFMPVSIQVDGDTIVKTVVRVAKRNGWA
jgi:hypothetical protein